MKLMKKLLLGITLLLVLLTAFSGCETMQEGSAELKDATVVVLDALDAGDVNAAYACFADVVTKQEFANFAKQVAPYFEGDGYELKQTYIGFVTQNGVTEKKAEFLMTNEQGSFAIITCIRTDMEGIVAFHISPYTVREPVFSPISVIVGILSFLEIGFVAVLLVDCCRRKMKNKTLMLLLILFGTLSLVLEIGNNVNLQCNYLSWFGYTSFKAYQDGAFKLRILIPIGAIVYLFMRKRLIAEGRAAEQAQAAQVPVENAVEQQTETLEPVIEEDLESKPDSEPETVQDEENKPE